MKRTLIALGLAAGLTVAFSGGKAAFADDFHNGRRADRGVAAARIAVTYNDHGHGPAVTVGYRHRDSCDVHRHHDRHDRYTRRNYRRHLSHDCWCGRSHSDRHYAKRYRHRHAHRDAGCGSYSFHFRW